ncbi:uracil-DNA glycosylase [Candidatus Pelagibacter sp. HTCC7211]|jgi:uracil-DNA glycosylase family 4|uniref:uracil-DNA glycosylase n=1 Tax=Pelagibacter sp. (strain HTCC7211) TaxID=439493 RepID=UPI0001839E50|nr:uracil-DNA glycosylase [Candidatus Pelagibacter sp. HTCC7211]EDZ59876.1 uracil-DNA glycosylase [Candidatus Pelagibacter sp. HTCC7211]MBD1151560.1 uracil-DNA glycosylase [Pelagibacterales bacterium SAG-MED25]|tara:strand:+ start:27 stop:707 length:681 start_codon:yes stop_codon:yes gene_type:complete
MSIKFKNINKTIIKCKKCPRLVEFIKKISTNKRKQNINETYWGKPVTGFGDINAKILILGLAPAAHGGTRTGRAFTGDKSGEFLFKCLHEVKIANQSRSENINDNLKLDDAYITNILKCVPPNDKPLKDELNNCSKYFDFEIKNLKKLKTIIALGKVAFDSCIKHYKKRYKINKKIVFKHGKFYLMPDNIVLISCYHPSPRNVNTKLISLKMMVNLFKKVKRISKV